MKNQKPLLWLAAAILVTGLFTACESEEEGDAASGIVAPVPAVSIQAAPVKHAEKTISPFSFRIAAGSLLERNYAAKIEKDNAKLSRLLVACRENVMEKASFAPAYWIEEMGDTYLRSPTLTDEAGTAFVGWESIFPVLMRIAKESTYIGIQSIHVEMHYLPSSSSEFIRLNEGRKPGDMIDFIGHITCVLVHASDPTTFRVSGELPHRTSCDPIW